ncbi:hypothetical protein [Kyrpidia tusciae]|uniref:hypothetical protein n=1 Tax=Kyrpidia tusciae TaxID=33943 RepID=UPI000F510B18|nr:hypothetical protein [Kyrpidia tusciae]
MAIPKKLPKFLWPLFHNYVFLDVFAAQVGLQTPPAPEKRNSATTFLQLSSCQERAPRPSFSDREHFFNGVVCAFPLSSVCLDRFDEFSG